MGMERKRQAIIGEIYLKKIIKQLKKGEFNYVYTSLKKRNYIYTLEKLSSDFSSINSKDIYCYIIYLISREYTSANIILLCDYIMYLGTFFYDIHPVIYLFINQYINICGNDKLISNWIVTTYDNHPDSPFSLKEIELHKKLLMKNLIND